MKAVLRHVNVDYAVAFCPTDETAAEMAKFVPPSLVHPRLDLAVIEKALADGRATAVVDAQRHVDCAAMRQIRNDDPTKYRTVRREPPIAATSKRANEAADDEAETEDDDE